MVVTTWKKLFNFVGPFIKGLGPEKRLRDAVNLFARREAQLPQGFGTSHNDALVVDVEDYHTVRIRLVDMGLIDEVEEGGALKWRLTEEGAFFTSLLHGAGGAKVLAAPSSTPETIRHGLRVTVSGVQLAPDRTSPLNPSIDNWVFALRVHNDNASAVGPLSVSLLHKRTGIQLFRADGNVPTSHYQGEIRESVLPDMPVVNPGADRELQFHILPIQGWGGHPVLIRVSSPTGGREDYPVWLCPGHPVTRRGERHPDIPSEPVQDALKWLEAAPGWVNSEGQPAEPVSDRDRSGRP